MPICEADPWRLQYFERANCPLDVNIPTEDSDAWLWYPEHRWAYDKIAIARSQGLDAAPPSFELPLPRLDADQTLLFTLRDTDLIRSREPLRLSLRAVPDEDWPAFLAQLQAMEVGFKIDKSDPHRSGPWVDLTGQTGKEAIRV